MKKIAENEYKTFLSWAGANKANRVYPCSIAEGFQVGDIYVNEGSAVEAVFFWHFCGFGYISGNASAAFLEDIYAKMLAGQNGRRLVLITSDPAVTAFFRGKEVSMDERVEYSWHQPGNGKLPMMAGGLRIESITPENIGSITGRIVPSFSWESPERFLSNGFGYAAFDKANVAAVAFSAAISSDEIDIGVETKEAYRRKGLAALLANQMCEHIVSLGKKPVWAHAASNQGSQNTALRCGFTQNARNTVIRRRQ